MINDGIFINIHCIYNGAVASEEACTKGNWP